MVRITGGCHCGAITYAAEVDPGRIAVCHCTDCQSLTGSPFRVTIEAATAALEVTGAPRRYEKRGDSGAVRILSFCGECGAPLFTTGTGEAAAATGIRWGSVAERDQLKPRLQIWRRSAVDWLGEIDALPARQRD